MTNTRLDPLLPIPTRLESPLEPARQLELLPIPGGVDQIGISGLSMKGQSYKIQWGDPSKRLRQGQRYSVIQMKDSDHYVLVRQQDRPDQDRQLVAVFDPVEQTGWIDQSESTEPYTHIYIMGARRNWILDEPEKPPIVSALRILGIVEAILVPVDVAESRAEDMMLTDPNRFEMIAANQLHMTVPLPSFLPVSKFFSDTLNRLETVDSLYSILALVHIGRVEVVKDFLSSLKENGGDAAIPNSTLHTYLSVGAVEPLRLVRFHYGSDAITDVFGIGKIFETIISLRERWRKCKYEEELLKRDIKLKDEEILAKQAERRKLDIQTLRNVSSV
jgi:hypothetical protein